MLQRIQNDDDEVLMLAAAAVAVLMIATCAERLTVSTTYAAGSSLLRTPCTTDVLPVPTGPTNITG